MSQDLTRQQKIDAIRRLPDQLEQTLAALTPEEFRMPYREGGWTPTQIVHHLADSHMNAFVRMKLILAEELPTLKPYDQDAWSRLPDANSDPRSSLQIVRGLHERMVTLLENVTEKDWSRTGLHPENGEMSLDQILTIYARHGSNHVAQIEKVKEQRQLSATKAASDPA